MSLYEGDGTLNCPRKILIYFRLVDEASGIRPDEARTTNSRIREAATTVFTEEQHGTQCGYFSPPVLHSQPKRTARGGCKRTRDRRKELGSSSEVNCFRVDFRTRLFIEEGVPGETSDLGDDFWTSAPIGGAQPDVDSSLWTIRLHIEGSYGVRNRNDDDFSVAPGMNLDVRNKNRANGVRKCVGKTLLVCKGVNQAHDLFRAIADAQDDLASRCIREGYGRPDDLA
jgi:hypothetical protein